MPRLVRRVLVIPLVMMVGTGLASCTTGEEPIPDGSETTTSTPSGVSTQPTPAPTTSSTTPTPPPSPSPSPSPSPTALATPETVISVGPIDAPLSQAEIRVGEIIVEFDGTVTDEGTVLTLEEPILFDFGSADLKRGASDELDDIAEVLDFYADAPVVVEGHTDSIGDTQSNDALSQARADAVTGALADRGITAARMTSEGRGESEPVAANERDDGSDNPDGRARNRRVEVLVVGVEPPVDDS